MSQMSQQRKQFKTLLLNRTISLSKLAAYWRASEKFIVTHEETILLTSHLYKIAVVAIHANISTFSRTALMFSYFARAVQHHCYRNLITDHQLPTTGYLTNEKQWNLCLPIHYPAPTWKHQVITLVPPSAAKLSSSEPNQHCLCRPVIVHKHTHHNTVITVTKTPYNDMPLRSYCHAFHWVPSSVTKTPYNDMPLRSYCMPSIECLLVIIDRSINWATDQNYWLNHQPTNQLIYFQRCKYSNKVEVTCYGI